MTTINSQEDFLRVLSENPEWRAAVRAQILGEELIQLPAKFDAFVQRMDAFIEEQTRFNARIDGFIEEQIRFNAETRAFVAKMSVFVDDQQELNARMDARLNRLTHDSAQLRGWLARTSAAEFAPLVAMNMGMVYVRNLERAELARMSQGDVSAGIAKNELISFVYADVVIEAELEGSTHYIAVEASYTADHRDTDRALRNAEFLTRFTGLPAHAAIVSVRNDRELDDTVQEGSVYWQPIPDHYWEPD